MATIQEKFERFHQDNPHIMKYLVKLTREAKRAGEKKVGIGQLVEVLRWDTTIRTHPRPKREYKIDNNFRSRYVRLIQKTYPRLADMFETRNLRSE